MPTIRPVSDLQRSAASLVREAMETKEPIYLTKNGSSAVVLLDAEEFDMREKSLKRLWARYIEMSYLLGDAEQEAGRTASFESIVQQMREKWGDDVF